MWLYKGEEFNDAEGYKDFIGFVYLITDNANGKKYVGKKLLWSKRKLKPLKGQRRKRTVIKESDWKTYYGSNDEIKTLVETVGPERFKREILYFCKTKGELSYKEAKEQFDREVLFKPDEYYNGIIHCRVSRRHIGHML
jgi:hypothetical protein